MWLLIEGSFAGAGLVRPGRAQLGPGDGLPRQGERFDEGARTPRVHGEMEPAAGSRVREQAGARQGDGKHQQPKAGG